MSYKPHTPYKDYQSKNITASEPIGVNEKLAVIKRIEEKTAYTVLDTIISIQLQDIIEVRLYALAVFTLAQEIKLASQ